ncbi:MAG: transposase [Chloroflexi bacterium]|nr:transposase [Chloroflexota bacterium]
MFHTSNTRNNPGIARDSDEWKRLYNKRVSVERLFSRMKECRRLSKLRHRGVEKVRVHVYLSTLTILASAIASLHSKQPLRAVA